jgi:hypothetical protein
MNVPALVAEGADALDEAVPPRELSPLPHAGSVQQSSRLRANGRRTGIREQTSMWWRHRRGPV